MPTHESRDTDTDIQTLHSLGYAQELQRRMSGFSNYAISLSIICILAGCITSFHVGLCSVGGASIGLCWPLMSLLALAFAATMAQVASAFPTAGGLYHWGSILGGRGWGWATAWFNLAGLITALAAINQATFQFMLGAFGPRLGLTPEAVGHWLGVLGASSLSKQILHPEEASHWTILMVQILAVSLITFSQAIFNHRGIRTTTRLTDLSGYLILIVSVLLTGALLFLSQGYDFGRLVTFTNYSGMPEEAPIWPRTENMAWLFALGILLPAYTITGFDASAHTAEETVGAAEAVPRGIVRSVVVSGIFGWLLLIALVIAAPDLDQAVRQGAMAFFWITDQVLPAWLNVLLLIAITFAQYCCGLAMVTSASRMVFAFARDGGLPASPFLRHVCPRFRTPSRAVWVAASLAVAFTALVPYITITAVAVIFLYISYLMPTISGLMAHGRTWTKMGPWSLGAWYKPLAVVCILGGLLLFAVGVQPPNDIALRIVPGATLLLAIYWFAFKSRHFAGPPSGEEIDRRQAEIQAAERALDAAARQLSP
jgi:amino acid transporter